MIVSNLSRLVVTALVAALCVACSGSPEDDGPARTAENTEPVATLGVTAEACAPGRAGCACPRQGERVSCGIVEEKRADGRIVCGEGGSVCDDGKWSACTLGAYAGGH